MNKKRSLLKFTKVSILSLLIVSLILGYLPVYTKKASAEYTDEIVETYSTSIDELTFELVKDSYGNYTCYYILDVGVPMGGETAYTVDKKKVEYSIKDSDNTKYTPTSNVTLTVYWEDEDTNEKITKFEAGKTYKMHVSIENHDKIYNFPSDYQIYTSAYDFMTMEDVVPIGTLMTSHENGLEASGSYTIEKNLIDEVSINIDNYNAEEKDNCITAPSLETFIRCNIWGVNDDLYEEMEDNQFEGVLDKISVDLYKEGDETDKIEEGEELLRGQSYYFKAVFELSDNKHFALGDEEGEFTINLTANNETIDASYQISEDDGTTYLYVYSDEYIYKRPFETINTIELNKEDEINIAGDIVKDNYITSDEDAHYTIKSGTWEKLDEQNDDYISVATGAAVVCDDDYRYKMVIASEEGYIFNDSAVININGEESDYAEIEEINSDKTEVTVYFYLDTIEHDWNTEWSYNDDAHWHDCNCTDCTIEDNEEKSGYAAHSYNEGVVTKIATADEEGIITYTCTVCGHEKTESISKSPEPSGAPSSAPSENPTESTAPQDSFKPGESGSPSEAPSGAPSENPTESTAPQDSFKPGESGSPSEAPSLAPSENPTESAAPQDSFEPGESGSPSEAPSLAPSKNPTESTVPQDSFKPGESGSPSETAVPGTSPSPSASDSVKKGDVFTYKSSKYVIIKPGTGGTVAYKCPTNKIVKTMTIPATLKYKGVTYKVVEIKPNAFKKCLKLTKVTIGKNIKKIGKNAFSGCKLLKSIALKTSSLTAKTVGANAFKGLHKNATIKVPKKKLKLYKKILKKKGLKGKKQKVKGA